MADLLLTDPPYNVDYKGKAGKIKNDAMSTEHFRQFLMRVFEAANTALRDGGSFYVWYSSKEVVNFSESVEAAGLSIHQELVWVKDSFILGRMDYHSRHEPCLYGWKESGSHFWNADRKQSSAIDLIPEKVEQVDGKVRFKVNGRVFECPAGDVFEVVDGTVIPMAKPVASRLHPTMKPVKLFEYQIKNSTKQDGIVLDLFGGSGTTAIACEKCHRQARLMELDEKFVDVIRKRWAEFVYGEGCDWEAKTPAEG